MIPIQLSLKNFLSYRDATLDFSGLHTACICGSNGAGKSSLLEAITWSIWGQSRAAAEDDLIYTTAKDVRVDFIFQINQQIYRIIRTRQRGQSSALEFQVATNEDLSDLKFRSLSGKGLRATQQLVIYQLKLDYDTFINSAYLRQGRADEFMLRKPTERKQILADLLKLSRYEELAEHSKERSRDFKILSEQLEQNLKAILIQLDQREAIAAQQATLEEHLQQLQAAQNVDSEKLQSLQGIENQRQTWVQQLEFIRQQHRNLTQDCDRLQQDITKTQAQQRQIEVLLSKESEISAGYNQYLKLQTEEEKLSSQFAAYTQATEQLRQVQLQQEKQVRTLENQLQQSQAQLDALQQQQEECAQTLSRSAEIEAGLAQLQQARNYLNHLDQIKEQVDPLEKQRTQIQIQLDRAHAQLSAKLEQVHNNINQQETKLKLQPQIAETLLDVETKIQELEKKRVYQQRIQEKGLEKRSFQDRVKENQRNYEKQLEELQQKLEVLIAPNACCPLCDRPMEEAYNHRVLEKTKTQQQEIQDYLWDLDAELAVSEREIQGLRQQYSQISQDLSEYDELLQKRGQLLAQLEAMTDVQNRCQQLVEEAARIERSLETSDYATDLQQELLHLNQQIQQLNYDQKNHALARNELEKWRWAEIKQAEIKQAQRRQAQLDAQIPELLTKISNLLKQIEIEKTDSELSQKIAALNQQIIEIDYDQSRHNSVRNARQEYKKNWEEPYRELQQAQHQYPTLVQRGEDLTKDLQRRSQDRDHLTTQIETVTQQINQIPDITNEIKAIEQQIATRRQQLDSNLAQLGSLQQQLTQLENLQIQYETNQKQQQTVKQQYRVYQALAEAFGKNGIQTLMIENILPQMEAETNSLLARLTGNQLHVQFVTQKTGRSGSRSSKKAAKMIDTLDILIADARGTRPYETYSGGEAFRINFAIRLALARLLAQRSGTALQLLIVDEGFGTQDQEGCDRLVAAINAIASDFACILTVTHMPYFKEAFQARIEVYKTQNGSQLALSI